VITHTDRYLTSIPTRRSSELEEGVALLDAVLLAAYSNHRVHAARKDSARFSAYLRKSTCAGCLVGFRVEVPDSEGGRGTAHRSDPPPWLASLHPCFK